MHDKPVFLTPDGRAKLEAELQNLREVKRPEIAERIHTSKEFSDTTDNAEFEEAKNEQAFTEGRILTIEKMLAHAEAIDVEHHKIDQVGLGSSVTVKTDEGDEEKYVIVGSAEVDAGHGKISNESPIGRALMGHKIGDVVEVHIPAGMIRLEVAKIA